MQPRAPGAHAIGCSRLLDQLDIQYLTSLREQILELILRGMSREAANEDGAPIHLVLIEKCLIGIVARWLHVLLEVESLNVVFLMVAEGLPRISGRTGCLGLFRRTAGRSRFG